MKSRCLILAVCLLGLLLSCESEKVETIGPEPQPALGPTVELVSPQPGDTIGDYVHVEAVASDDKGVVLVEFYVDAELAAADPAPPYSILFSTTKWEHATNHVFYAVAYDTDENRSSTPTTLCVFDSVLALPVVPEVQHFEAVTPSEVSMAWSMSPDPDFKRYIITWDTVPEPPFTMFTVYHADRRDTTVNITHLRDNITYRFRIASEDTENGIAHSEIMELTTPNAVPPVLEVVSLVRRQHGVEINWKPTDIWDFDAYYIWRSDDVALDASDTLVATIVEQDTRTFTDVSADTLMTYYYFLEVLDDNGVSSFTPGYEVGQYISSYCLSLSGRQCATVPYDTSLDLGNEYTLEAWVFPTEHGSFARVIDKSPEGVPYMQYSLICSDVIKTDLCTGGQFERWSSYQQIPQHEWSHIAITYDKGAIKFYFNGTMVQERTANYTGSCSFETPLNLGRRGLYDEFYYTGKMDEIRAWDVVRTESEITESYDRRIYSAAGLVLYLTFDEGAGDTIRSFTGLEGFLGKQPGQDAADPAWDDDDAPIRY